MSGSEPVAVDVSQRSTDTGVADWSDNGIHYHFEVTSRHPADVHADPDTQSAGRGLDGLAVAYTEVCDRTCTELGEWRGGLGSRLTEGGVYTVTPTLDRATFDGWLFNQRAEQNCKFHVTWEGEAQPAVRTSQDAAQDETHTHAVAGAEATRFARASVTADCWGAGSAGWSADAVGRISSSSGIGTDTFADVRGRGHPIVCNDKPIEVCVYA